MWICRLVPAVLWLVRLVALALFTPNSKPGVLEILLLVLLVPYLLLVLFVLPELLFPGAR